MVSSSAISLEDKEELPHKSGLIKLEDGSWKQVSTNGHGESRLFF